MLSSGPGMGDPPEAPTETVRSLPEFFSGVCVNCRACGLSHSPLVRCEIARNIALASNASNAASNRTVPQEDVRTDRPTASPDTVSGAGKKQRWSRDSYNAYQRDLMRKRRAEGRA
jgi:hypothetical protein